MQAYPRQGVLGPSPGLRVSWVCADTLRGGACAAGFYLPQPRLTALLDRGLRQAFAAARQRMEARPLGPEEEAAAQERRHRQREAAQRARRRLRPAAAPGSWRATRPAFSRTGPLWRRAWRRSPPAGWRRRRRCRRSARRRPPGPGRSGGGSRTLGRLWTRFEAVWPRDWWLPRDPDKAEFLKDLGLTASVRLHPMQKAPCGCPKSGPPGWSAAPRNGGAARSFPRLTCGLCELDLVCPPLGIGSTEPLRVWETDQELKDYNRLRLFRSVPPFNP